MTIRASRATAYLDFRQLTPDIGHPAGLLLQLKLGARYRAVGRAVRGISMTQWTLPRAMRWLALWRPDWLTRVGFPSLRAVMAIRWPLTASPTSNSVVIDPYSSFLLQLTADVHNHVKIDP